MIKKIQYCPYDTTCGTLYDCTREEYETMKQSNIKLSLQNSDLQQKLAIVNEMNVANYNKYCEELKENQLLKKKYENAVADYEYEHYKNQKAIEYIEQHTNNTVEYLDVWEVKELLEILKGDKEWKIK